MDDEPKRHPLGGDQGKAGAEIEAQLMAKDAARAGAGAVAPVGAVGAHEAQQVEIGLHRAIFEWSRGRNAAQTMTRIPTIAIGSDSRSPIVTQSMAI